MIYAEIKSDGRVHQVWYDVNDDSFSPPLLPGSSLVSFNDGVDVRPGMLWDGKNLIPNTNINLDDIKAVAKKNVLNKIEIVSKQLADGYPSSERESWPVKLAAAEAYVSGSATAVQKTIIETEADLVGVQPIDLANLIITKAKWFAEVAATISAIRQKAFAAIDAATDRAGVDAAVAAAKSEADVAIQDLLARKP